MKGGTKPYLAHKVPAAVDDATPDLAGVQPSGKGLVGAEHEQQGECKAGQVERLRGVHCQPDTPGRQQASLCRRAKGTIRTQIVRCFRCEMFLTCLGLVIQ